MSMSMMRSVDTIALAVFTTMAHVLSASAALPAPAATPVVPAAAAGGTQSADEFETGAVCKTYNRDTGTFFNSNAVSLRSFLESSYEVDKGYNASEVRFDAKPVAKPGHEYNAVTWEGRFNSPITEEFQFVVTGARGCPFIVTINGETIQGSGQGILKVGLVKGIENKVYIASGSEDPITIQYTLTKYAKAEMKYLVPSALKHVVEEEVPDFELK